MKNNFFFVILFILQCLLWKPSFAAVIKESTDESMQPKGVKSQFSKLWEELSDGFEYSVRTLASGTIQDPANSSQNPDNDFFQIPQYLADLELRPDFYLNFRLLQLSVKPRVSLEWRAWGEGDREGETDWDDDCFVNEWLARIRMTQNLFVSYGRENLQWGPSYLFSPSNPFFRDNGRSNPKREVPGMDFARLVWLPAMSWTLSVIANLDKGRQEFLFFEFEKTYALKLDYAGQEAYAGLILSRKENDRDRLGAFGGWTATDALLLYGEGTIAKGTDALYPEEANNPFGASMLAIDDEASSLKGIVLIGGSYTLEIGPTLTMEYIYNGPGYSNRQAKDYYRLRNDASDAFDLTGPISDLSRLTLSRTADPGLRFLRRNYVMFQYNHNDIWDVLNLTFRWTQNIDDGSGQFISIVEYFVGEHTQLFSIGTINSGAGDTEFGSILDYQWMIGLGYTF
ncbi:MAG: hypothetical protein L6406_14635 [Desulfobacterales bacterium]|nr:hypothetical protein [Desulfobacterales bacterium]